MAEALWLNKRKPALMATKSCVQLYVRSNVFVGEEEVA